MSIKSTLNSRYAGVNYSSMISTIHYLGSRSQIILVAVSITLLLSLFACGGGGGSGAAQDPEVPVPKNDPIEFVNPGPVGEAVSIKGDLQTSASHSLPVVKFNNSGIGISVWRIDSGTGGKIVYSLYDPLNENWSEETDLYYGSNIESQRKFFTRDELQVATNGSGFAITWTDTQDVFVKTFNPTSTPQWSDVNKLNSTRIGFFAGPKIASDGAEYMVSWREDRKIVASMSTGMQWSALPDIIGDIVSPGLPGAMGYTYSGIEIISNGHGFLVSWAVSERTTNPDATLSHLYTSIYTSATKWGTVFEVNETNLDLEIRTIKLAENAEGYIVFWWTQLGRNQPFIGKANIYHSTAVAGPSWLGENIVTGQIDGTFRDVLVASNNGFVIAWNNMSSQTNEQGMSANIFTFSGATGWQGTSEILPAAVRRFPFFNIASTGESFMVVWSDDNTIYSKLHNGVLWDTDASILATTDRRIYRTPAIHSNGSDYLVAWQLQDATLQIPISVDTYASRYVPETGWSESVLVETNASEKGMGLFSVRETIGISNFNTQYFVNWISETSSGAAGISHPRLRKFDGNMNDAQDLSKRQHLGSSNLPSIISNENHQLLTIWLQSVKTSTQVFASVRSSEKWSNPTQIDDDKTLVVNSSSAWRPGSESRFYNIASNGSTFMVVWNSRNSVFSRLFDGQGWSAVPLSVSSEGLGGREPFVTALNNGYISVWNKRSTISQTSMIYSAIYKNGNWTPQLVAEVTGTNLFASVSGGNPKVASNRSGDYIVVWNRKNSEGKDEIHARINIGGQWVNQDTLMQITTAPYTSHLQIAANDFGKFIVSWTQNDGSRTSPNSGIATTELNTNELTWSPAEVLAQSGDPVRPNLKSNGKSFAIAWGQASSTRSVIARIYDNDKWGPNFQLLIEANKYIDGVVQLTANGDKYALVWQDWNYVSEKMQSNISIYDGINWGAAVPLLTSTEPQSYFNPSVSAYKDNFAAAWVQNDPAVGPVFTSTWTKTGGF